jgi:hypothetical protein
VPRARLAHPIALTEVGGFLGRGRRDEIERDARKEETHRSREREQRRGETH